MYSSYEELIDALKPKLQEYLEEHGIDCSGGKKFLCINPNHNDSTPSANIYKDGISAHCHSCGFNISIFVAAHVLENRPLEGKEFIKENVLYLAEKYGLKYSIYGANEEQIALKQGYLRAYKLVADYIKATAKENPTDSYKSELRKRKWPLGETYNHGIGCVDSFDNIHKLLNENGFTNEGIDMLGLLRKDLFSSDGVIFTVYDEFERPIAFYMRDTKFEEKKIAYENRDKLDISTKYPPVKYNSSQNHTGIYEKVLHPYGIHDIKHFHKIMLVEGHGCKLSLKLNGIDNVVALGGTSLSKETIDKFVSLGVTSLSLLLDNDTCGREKVKNIIRQFYGKIKCDISVMDMSALGDDSKDPDEFIRKNGIDKFKLIPEKNALEWFALSEILEKSDTYAVLNELTPLIAQERSPLNRLRIISTLADATDIDKDVITEEVEQRISMSKDRKGEFAIKVLKEAEELISMNPGALDAAVHLVTSKLGNINKDAESEELFSSNECLQAMVKLQDLEESDEVAPIITTGFSDWDKEIQLPINEAFILVAACPNAGKTTALINFGLGMLLNNPTTMVIMHTIDDSRSVYVNRYISAISKIRINWIKNPNFFLDEELKKKRRDAYHQVNDFIRDERLIIKDVTHGNTVEYHGKLIEYYRNRYPDRNIVVFCDNLHRLDTEVQYDDGRFKFTYISSAIKEFTTKYSCVEICTVETTKMGMYDKPTNAGAIKETASLQFDANMILCLWNELNVSREEAVYTFQSKTLDYNNDIKQYVQKTSTKPIIEALVLKNKLSEFKGSIFFKFHPELAVYEDVTFQEVKELVEQNETAKPKKETKDKKDWKK